MGECTKECEAEYVEEISKECYNSLVRGFNEMKLGRKKMEEERETGLETYLDESVIIFVKLLSEKLDQTTIQNMFGQSSSPTCNMLLNMLENHKLRSTFDFEKAVSRKWDLNRVLGLNPHGHVKGASHISWNFRWLDSAAGIGTSVETIFQLKEIGAFKGAKRRLKFSAEDEVSEPGCKHLKIDELSDLLGGVNIDEKSSGKTLMRSSINLKMSSCVGGWHGNKKSPPTGKKAKTKVGMKEHVQTPNKGKERASSGFKTPSSQSRKKRSYRKVMGGGQCSILQYARVEPSQTTGSAVDKDCTMEPKGTGKSSGV